MAEQYAWVRREGESSPAYGAFRSYLDMGHERSLSKVCEDVGKSWQLITKWSSQHEWIERVRQFDAHLATAETDGMVNQLAAVRDKNLALMDKLRDHLSDRLDYFIQKKDDPTIRWTQALTAMAKIEANSLIMGKDDSKTSDAILRVEAIMERLDRELEDK